MEVAMLITKIFIATGIIAVIYLIVIITMDHFGR